MTDEHTPFEAGLAKSCNLETPPCLGHRALADQQEPSRMIRPIEILGDPVPEIRDRWMVADEKGNPAGAISSTVWPPEFKTNVAIGMVDRHTNLPGSRIVVHAPDGEREAVIRDAFRIKRFAAKPSMTWWRNSSAGTARRTFERPGERVAEDILGLTPRVLPHRRSGVSKPVGFVEIAVASGTGSAIAVVDRAFGASGWDRHHHLRCYHNGRAAAVAVSTSEVSGLPEICVFHHFAIGSSTQAASWDVDVRQFVDKPGKRSKSCIRQASGLPSMFPMIAAPSSIQEQC
ncbi:MAG: hypothetical protein OXI81_22000 [Paracoccaceae bacterium]|nr:hypothetical protein [Paracoccaceae bacterium]